jgi:hypothetical protein
MSSKSEYDFKLEDQEMDIQAIISQNKHQRTLTFCFSVDAD